MDIKRCDLKTISNEIHKDVILGKMDTKLKQDIPKDLKDSLKLKYKAIKNNENITK